MDDIPQQPLDAAARAELERIARALDQPVSAFFDSGAATMREAETLALVNAFARIHDVQARARCLAFVAFEANREQRD